MNYPGRVIKKGEKNADVVMAIQRQLNLKGLGPLEVDGEFGPLTESAVKEFQSQHVDAYGVPLVFDGLVGSVTWSVLFGSDTTESGTEKLRSALLEKAVSMAESQLGILEEPPGSNRGVMVEQFQSRAGISPGDPWCAAFVYWCFAEAAGAAGLSNPLPRTGSCMYHWDHAKGHRIVKQRATNDPSLLMPGHIFIINHGNYRGHTGIVTSVKNGYVQTIEGNSNTGGSREGVGVVSLSRKIVSINQGFIDYSR
jgi:peptidoglycan hydrolase-like protein with peptidoglycan-binding domain